MDDETTPAVPPFTSSIDARVPAENVVLSHLVTEAGKWIAASQASDGRVFMGYAATEPLARRAAGLRTLAYLQARAAGDLPDMTEKEVEAARDEFVRELDALKVRIMESNLEFPVFYSQSIVLLELEVARKLAIEGTERGLLARWAAPVLLFLVGAFAQGVIGVYAQRVLTALETVLAR